MESTIPTFSSLCTEGAGWQDVLEFVLSSKGPYAQHRANNPICSTYKEAGKIMPHCIYTYIHTHTQIIKKKKLITFEPELDSGKTSWFSMASHSGRAQAESVLISYKTLQSLVYSGRSHKHQKNLCPKIRDIPDMEEFPDGLLLSLYQLCK